MREMLLALKADINADLRAIDRIYAELDRQGDAIANDEQAIVIGYYLHNLYNAFESIFQRVAETFENDVADSSRWHALLLRRMTLDIENVRPRLLSDETYQCLDELRRFRHLFRSLYTSNLDVERLRLVLRKARTLEDLYRADTERFLTYLDELG
jgi:hypothetical protein